MTLSNNWVTLLGAGNSAVAPGTVGSLVAMLLWPVFLVCSLELKILLWITLFALSWFFTQKVLQAQTDADPSWVVIDEALAVWLIPIAFQEWSLYWLWVWMLFRLLDIVKPWPVSMIERMKPDVFAVIFDDIVAVLLAILCVKFWVITL